VSKHTDHAPECIRCGEEYFLKRRILGYMTCKDCGDIEAREVKRTVVPMHKSNYIMLTDMADLKGINNKGGFHR